MIGSIRHKALSRYWTRGQARGLNGEWMSKLRRILSALEAAERPEHMNYPGSYFHALKGDRAGRYAVRLTANWRVTFGWAEDSAVDVDIEDYHQ
ncbi:MAG: type II toxin-antitoxin system RelE/ParE family toxin [Alphaproteobacteria bacterium]|nr:type II toxin-antitoxin system RelE/ParE family toxin [Alphaproteobacteria bacterium]